MLETEIKLGPALPEQAQRAYDDQTMLLSAGEEQILEMRTCYYDSPSNALAANQQMVRLRWENGRGVCTFKGRAQDFSRLELECPATDIQTGAGELAAYPEMPPDSAAILKGELIPVCGAEFIRRTRLCRAEDTLMSFCWDQGFFVRGSVRQPFCELELELVEGNLGRLMEVARQLSAVYHLPVCHLSKQQRAMALEVWP